MPKGRVLTLWYDDLQEVPRERLRSNACVELRAEEEPVFNIELGTVGGERYAVYRHAVPYESIS